MQVPPGAPTRVPRPHAPSPRDLVAQLLAGDDGDLLAHPLVGVEVVPQAGVVLLDDHPGGLLHRLRSDASLRGVEAKETPVRPRRTPEATRARPPPARRPSLPPPAGRSPSPRSPEPLSAPGGAAPPADGGGWRPRPVPTMSAAAAEREQRMAGGARGRRETAAPTAPPSGSEDACSRPEGRGSEHSPGSQRPPARRFPRCRRALPGPRGRIQRWLRAAKASAPLSSAGLGWSRQGERSHARLWLEEDAEHPPEGVRPA